MSRPWLLLLVVGCAEMEPSSNVLTPVAPPAAPEAASAAPVEAPLPLAAEPFSISSEQLQANAEEAEAAGVPPPQPFGVVAASEPEPEGTPPPPAAPAPPPPAPAVASAPWPVRLVKTVPESQPPRAILALPDGAEVVVTPGELLPAQGLVVMAVGRNTVQLAQVRGEGDRAVIEPLTLQSQY